MTVFHYADKRNWSAGLRVLTILFLILSAFGPGQATPVYADKLVCGIPGNDGPTTTLSGVVNTYYPGVANATAGTTSITLGGAVGATIPIQAGDLLLVVQMQGADIDSTNTSAYGNGAAGDPGAGNLAANFTAGRYEYVVATNAVALGGGALTVSSGLTYDYFNQDYPVGAGNQGQRRFQVIRIPQYSSATMSGTVTAPAWNGTVGGVVALDVAGTLNLGGNSIDVSGKGFRGGGGIRYTGGTGLNTDYRTLSTNTANASKGEGTAGTPRLIYNGSGVTDQGVALEGYPNGSFARGAPGNAGGGGTDGNPAANPGNDQNTGGGGGGNAGAGGHGGTAWANPGADSGGFGGAAFPVSPARLALGGGGGAGTIDDNNGVLSSGAAGGGIVMVRAGTVAGNGTINVNGAAAPGQILNDSGGGGGAGGSVIVMAKNGALPAGLNVTANGGRGGDAWPGQAPGATYPGARHGPGGGGGGGAIYLSSTAGTLTVAGGQNGITTSVGDNYLATPGAPGTIATINPGDVTNGISGAECIPTPTVVKTTSTPIVTQTASGTTGQYTITASVPANQGTALGFVISDTLPAGFTFSSTPAPVIQLSNGAARFNPSDPTNGTATPAWGAFNIPGGGQVQITFTVNIDATVPTGTYQNPATATYTDPTRTTSGGTTNTQYDPASSTGEDIQVVMASMPDLIVAKTNNVSGTVAQGSSFNWTITVTNSGAGPATFASGQTIMRDALPGNAAFYTQGIVTVQNGTTPPVGTIDCAINTTTLNCNANGIVTLATGASFSVTFPVTPSAAGNLLNTAVVDPDLIMPESNENNNASSDTVSVLGADLAITKTDGQPSYVAGSVVTYTVTVTNVSGVTANGATVSDTRPANVSTWAWACNPPTGGATGCDPAANSANDFTDTVNLPVGGTIVYTVTANVAATPAGDLVNTATVAVPPGFSDPVPANNTSTDTDTLTTLQADLSITKDDGQTAYTGGGTVTYTVTVANLSGADVTGGVVSDTKPANISTWAWACNPPTGGASGCDAAGNSASDFTDTVNLPVGSSIVYTVTANIIANPTGDLVNTATVTTPAGISDSNPANNTSTDTDALAVADLAITKNDNQVTYSGGAVLTYTVTVTNLSGVTVTGATVSDPKPANIDTWAWACTTQGGGATGCDPAPNSSNNFTDIVNVPVGGTIVYTVTANAIANPTTNLVNTATIALPQGISDSNPSNNTATDEDILGQAADLSLQKTSSTTTASAGASVTFTLTVTNIGPDPATGVAVTDQLPAGFTYVSASPSKGTYDSTTHVWTIGSMAVNEVDTLSMIVTVNASGPYTNIAEISASVLIDPDSTPNNGNTTEDDLGQVTITGPSGPRPTPTPQPGSASSFLIPRTGFRPGVATDMSNVPQETYSLAQSDVMLEIPSQGVKIQIVGVPKKNGTWNVAWLENQAGWLQGSAFPSWSGNSVLTGHVVLSDGLPGPFANLSKLKYGDKIVVHAYGQKYTFAVQSTAVVEPTDRSMMKHEEKPWLTLVTCKDYDPKTDTYLSRVLVRAALVSVEWEK